MMFLWIIKNEYCGTLLNMIDNWVILLYVTNHVKFCFNFVLLKNKLPNSLGWGKDFDSNSPKLGTRVE